MPNLPVCLARSQGFRDSVLNWFSESGVLYIKFVVLHIEI